MATYDGTFFKYVNSGAIQSAQYLLPALLRDIEISSVLDVGCGEGAWLSVWQMLGTLDIQGIDGDYVDRDHLLIPPNRFLPHDLTKAFDLGRRFDLVQSLEVAEHLPEEYAACFISSLVRHGELVLFSAAAKGQGGDNHVNEQDYDYWRALFERHDYVPLDYLRPIVLTEHRIERWYRYNTILYASAARYRLLPEIVRRSRVPQNQKLRDLSPPLYKVRKAVVRLLPVAVMTLFAKIKERLTVVRQADRRTRQGV